MPSTLNATTTNGLVTSADNSGSLQLQTNNGTTAVTINTSQNVGVGTASPNYRFEVNGSSVPMGINSTNNTNVLALSSSSTIGGYIGANGTNLVLSNNAGTEAMRIDSSGNVGVGTSSPSSFNAAADNLVVGTTSGNNGITIAGGTTGFSSIYMADGTTGNQAYRGYIEYRHSDDAMAFGTSASERMRIHPTGEVSIGSTGLNAKLFVDATNQIAVYGNVNGAQIAGYFTTGGANYAVYAQSSANYAIYGRTTDAGYGGCIGVAGNGTTYGIIGFANAWGLYTNASISVNGTTYTSDARLKENVVPISNALNTITQLNPVSFDWKANSARGIINNNTPLPDYGMIAQEVEQVLPDIVYEVPVPPKPIENNAPDSLEQELKACKGVDYSRLIPFLTKAIQELKAELDSVKAELNTLKNPPVEGTE